MSNSKMDSDTLLEILAQFTGTQKYHLHKIDSYMKIYLTDGCNYIRNRCAAYWLFDLILSWQTKPEVAKENFQFWTLQKQPDDTWIAKCEDGNKNVLALQKMEHSDFPLNEMTIWVVDNIALLPSEY